MNIQTEQKFYKNSTCKENNCEPSYFHFKIITVISILLFYILSALFFYACFTSMAAYNVGDTVQNIVVIILGVCVGLISFSLFKNAVF